MRHKASRPRLLDPRDLAFPDAELALREPDGLLAVGGDLSPARLMEAYRNGIFPWYSEGEPILWWSPGPRMVLFPERLHVSRSLRKLLKQGRYNVTFDQDFASVIKQCAVLREGGTWITQEMQHAYCRLHELGYAHSVECWRDDKLAGGLYGVALGRVFFGESMFSLEPNASKVALVSLVERLQQWSYRMIDCQVHSTHLQRLGAEDIPRVEFLRLLKQWRGEPALAWWG
ncbi:MAG: leucyl/phenylalanyl-tRNA--protein transferase [Gammaproteobacteria bacterium]|nr:MAG: leucyl/phenylalanyl-tRNA--protein transferase [Gammaproteobacteria bacterium]